MLLKVKKPSELDKKITQEFTKPIRRAAYISDVEMKQLKIMAITKETTIQVLLADVLAQILTEQPQALTDPNPNEPKRSFSIEASQLQALKLYAVTHDVAQDKVIYNAVLRIVK